MIKPIQGLHHITSLARNAYLNNHFYTHVLGLRRVKMSVNHDMPDAYHLYYGDASGTPGSITSYFLHGSFPQARYGTGEVCRIYYAVPEGSLDDWYMRLSNADVNDLRYSETLGSPCVDFKSPDKNRLALMEDKTHRRTGWTNGAVSPSVAILGLRGVRLQLADPGPVTKLLEFIGCQCIKNTPSFMRFRIDGGNPANLIDLEITPDAPVAIQGQGSVHHLAFAIEDQKALIVMRQKLTQAGYHVTPITDRVYFQSIYFRSQDGVLFEIATNAPGVTVDETYEDLGSTLKLPPNLEALRDHIEELLPNLKTNPRNI